MADMADLLVSRVSRAQRLGQRWLEPRLAALGITFAEMRITGLLLGEDEGVTQKDLADRLGVRPATLSTALSTLEAKGVVERVADPADARIKRVRVAKRPSELGRVRAILDALEARAVDGIGARDLKTAQRVLRRVAENLGDA